MTADKAYTPLAHQPLKVGAPFIANKYGVTDFFNVPLVPLLSGDNNYHVAYVANDHRDRAAMVRLFTAAPDMLAALDEWQQARSAPKIDFVRLGDAEHGLLKALAKTKEGA